MTIEDMRIGMEYRYKDNNNDFDFVVKKIEPKEKVVVIRITRIRCGNIDKNEEYLIGEYGMHCVKNTRIQFA